MNATVADVDLSKGQQINNDYPVVGTVNANGELTVSYNFNTCVEWPNGGLEFSVDYLSNVTNLSFDLIGDLENMNWTFIAYLLRMRQYPLGFLRELSAVLPRMDHPKSVALEPAMDKCGL